MTENITHFFQQIGFTATIAQALSYGQCLLVVHSRLGVLPEAIGHNPEIGQNHRFSCSIAQVTINGQRLLMIGPSLGILPEAISHNPEIGRKMCDKLPVAFGCRQFVPLLPMG